MKQTTKAAMKAEARAKHLHKLAENLTLAAYSERLGKGAAISDFYAINGPRSGALEIRAGFSVGDIRAALVKNDAAILRNLIPWQFGGDPSVFMNGALLRVEAAWPADLQDTEVLLSRLGWGPLGNARTGQPRAPQYRDAETFAHDHQWITGINENGGTLLAALDDVTPNWLLAGLPGSGKSTALQAAVVGLTRPGTNELIMLDGKYGASLRTVEHLSPWALATEIETMRDALGYAFEEMQRRYRSGQTVDSTDVPPRLVIVFDEFQDYMADAVISALMSRLARMGRQVNVHLIIATQHPSLEAFGGDTVARRCISGRMALRVADPKASEVALGVTQPQAHKLQGKGDMIVLTPNACHRAQGVLLLPRDVELVGAPYADRIAFPQFDPASLEGDETKETRSASRRPIWKQEEITSALLSAIAEEGRDKLRVRVKDALGMSRMIGATRARALLELGRQAWDEIADSDELAQYVQSL